MEFEEAAAWRTTGPTAIPARGFAEHAPSREPGRRVPIRMGIAGRGGRTTSPRISADKGLDG
ncbi:hypothetical protein ACFQX6_20725 [Streptosporangium lutulentum]